MSAVDDDRAKLSESVQFLKGVGPSRAGLLQKMGLRTAADLLFLFPRRYQDFTEQKSIAELEVGEQACVVGTVNDIDHVNAGGRRILNVLLAQEGGGFLRAVWFNQDHMLKRFAFGQTVQFRGKVSERQGRKQMTHPTVIWVEDGEIVPEGQLLPVYPLTDGINQTQMRKIVASAVEDYSELIEESFPKELRERFDVCDIQTAIKLIHAPKSDEESHRAQRRLVYQELLILQLAIAMRRHCVESSAVAAPLELSPKIKARILGRLPFELTESQRAVFDAIALDMNRAFPMNRLLHGEVGSGKTIVAVCAMMLSIAQEHQAVMMAPTEILAQQHFETVTKLLKDSRVKVALWTGSLKPADRKRIGAEIAAGEIDIVIGTTAIVESKLTFGRLGLVVIDEQHKFGVRQRARLKQSGFDPHYLVMTATPIPRTVTMTLFGDLDVSILERRQSKAKKINTYLGDPQNRDKW